MKNLKNKNLQQNFLIKKNHYFLMINSKIHKAILKFKKNNHKVEDLGYQQSQSS